MTTTHSTESNASGDCKYYIKVYAPTLCVNLYRRV